MQSCLGNSGHSHRGTGFRVLEVVAGGSFARETDLVNNMEVEMVVVVEEFDTLFDKNDFENEKMLKVRMRVRHLCEGTWLEP